MKFWLLIAALACPNAFAPSQSSQFTAPSGGSPTSESALGRHEPVFRNCHHGRSDRWGVEISTRNWTLMTSLMSWFGMNDLLSAKSSFAG